MYNADGTPRFDATVTKKIINDVKYAAKDDAIAQYKDEITGSISTEETASPETSEPVQVSSTRFRSTRRSSGSARRKSSGGGRRSSGGSSGGRASSGGGRYVSVASSGASAPVSLSFGDSPSLIERAARGYTKSRALPASYDPQIVKALELLKLNQVKTVEMPSLM